MSKKKIFLTIVLPILFVVSISIAIFNQEMKDNFEEKIKIIFTANYWWLLVALLLTATWWIIETLIFKHNATILPNFKNYTFKEAFVVTMVGVFYMAVTPFSSGGHGFQIYYMKKQGFKTSESLLVIVMNFIMYTWAMIIVAILFFTFEGKIIKQIYPAFLISFWVGISINIIQNAVLILSTTWKKFHDLLIKIYEKILIQVKKFKTNLNVEKKINSLEEDLKRYRSANKYLAKHKAYITKQILLNVVRFFLFALVPVIISFTLNMHYSSFYDFLEKAIMLIGTSIFVLVLQTVVPTPGASGAAELFLVSMWVNIFNDTNSAPVAMLLWRIITYYIHIIVSMPITFISLFKYEKKGKNIEKN